MGILKQCSHPAQLQKVITLSDQGFKQSNSLENHIV